MQNYATTDHVRSTGEVNVFKAVCDSVHEGGSLSHKAPGQAERSQGPSMGMDPPPPPAPRHKEEGRDGVVCMPWNANGSQSCFCITRLFITWCARRRFDGMCASGGSGLDSTRLSLCSSSNNASLLPTGGCVNGLRCIVLGLEPTEPRKD